MADDLRIVASNITASLITSGAVTVKDKDNEPVVKKAVSVFTLVLNELKDREREGVV